MRQRRQRKKMKVSELIAELKKLPPGDIILAKVIGDGEAADIIDIRVGYGTEIGLSMIVVDRSEELQSRAEQLAEMAAEY